MSELYFWNECKKTLEKDLSIEEYSTWIAPLLLEENSGSNPLSYTVLAPNKFISDWVEQNYGLSIEERLSAITSNADLNLAFKKEKFKNKMRLFYFKNLIFLNKKTLR